MLEQLLGTAYRAHVLDRNGVEIAARVMREAFEADQDLRAQAEARLAALKGHLIERDFISKVHQKMLRAALAPENA